MAFRVNCAAHRSRYRRTSSRDRRVDLRATTCTSSKIAIGSASEVRYLIGVAVRLGFIAAQDGDQLEARFGRVIRALQALVSALAEARGPRPEAQGVK